MPRNFFLILLFLSTKAWCAVELYSSDCGDLLRTLLLNKLSNAETKIEIRIYTFKDPKIIRGLENVLVKGRLCHLYTPNETPLLYSKKYPLFSHEKATDCKGLMHQKCVVIDEQWIWIGSANFTEDSLVRHQNSVLFFKCPELAHTLREKKYHHTFTEASGQMLEMWETPLCGKEALTRLIELINQAQKSIQVAMYTWTHQGLTQAIINAYKRGVQVELFLDPGSAKGTSCKTAQLIKDAKIPLFLATQCEMVHHKMMVVDHQTLVLGSLNWTQSAFSKNEDLFVIVHDLTDKQQKKLSKLWRRLHCLCSNQKALTAKLDSLSWKYP